MVLILFIVLETGNLTVKVGYSTSKQALPVSAINIDSPSNMTYSSNQLNLSLTFVSLLNPKYANLCYSIDGKSNVTIPLTWTQEVREVEITFENGTTIIANSTKFPFNVNGDAVLTELIEGPHHITVYAKYTANKGTSHDISQVYFTIDTNSKTSSIPEFPSWTLLPLLITVTLVAIIWKQKLNKKAKQQSY